MTVRKPTDWPEPRSTGNSQMLQGALGGMVHHDFLQRGGNYAVESLHPLILRHAVTGNRFEITVRQISGEE